MTSGREEKVKFDDLLVNIKSTRNVNEIKAKLERDQWAEAKSQSREKAHKAREAKQLKRRQQQRQRLPFETNDAEEEAELEAAAEQRRQQQIKKRVLETPLHSQAQQRIESKLAYRQTKNDLRQWQPIVDGLRVAEQLQFPHEERREDPLKTQTAEERAKGFTPRTELELRIAEVLDKSKSNIRNNEEFSQAELEMLKAMDLKEAKQKCAELRKMRALMSFHAVKLKRQSRIKSKQFHRIRKRQQRRELIKDVETLLVRDPEKAGERIHELERDRAYERATLKHRGTNKWTKQVRKFATRNPELCKVVEDHLRLGRELKGKHGAEGQESNSDDDDNDSAEDTDDDNGEEKKKKPLTTQQLVQRAAEQAENADGQQQSKQQPFPENPFYRTALENIRRERKTAAKQARKNATTTLMAQSAADGNVNAIKEAEGMDTAGKRMEKNQQPDFLDLNLRQIVQVPAELADGVDSDTDIQHAFLAAAYEDDDVIDEFQARKRKVEEEEGPQQKTSRYALMRGWGSWTGPGISEQREKQRMDRILGQEMPNKKRKERRRQDSRLGGVIIREQVSDGIQKLQPRDVPFPFTRIQDFEAYIQQPLGRDWNTPIAHQQLTKPAVVTKAGRIIRPLDKEVKFRRREFIDMIDSSQEQQGI